MIFIILGLLTVAQKKIGITFTYEWQYPGRQDVAKCELNHFGWSSKNQISSILPSDGGYENIRLLAFYLLSLSTKPQP